MKIKKAEKVEVEQNIIEEEIKMTEQNNVVENVEVTEEQVEKKQNKWFEKTKKFVKDNKVALVGVALGVTAGVVLSQKKSKDVEEYEILDGDFEELTKFEYDEDYKTEEEQEAE